jgi:hypothetical protein
VACYSELNCLVGENDLERDKDIPNHSSTCQEQKQTLISADKSVPLNKLYPCPPRLHLWTRLVPGGQDTTAVLSRHMRKQGWRL